MQTKKNAVIGAVRSYRFDQIEPFVLSLKKTGFSGDLVLLWNRLTKETRQKLTEAGVKLIHFPYRGSGAHNSLSRFWPFLRPLVAAMPSSLISRAILQTILPLQTSRFFAYRDFLEKHKEEYENVLITDVRDVFFQQDPFITFRSGLMVFEEDHCLSLGEETAYNASWIVELFGKEELAAIAHHPILCSGTSMGRIDYMLRYLAKFERLTAMAHGLSMIGSDQGIHNFLIRNENEKWFEVSKNGTGPVVTMSGFSSPGIDYVISDGGQALDPTGRIIPIIHQYDRNPEFAEKLLKSLNHAC
jgi:hypothetical protein